MSTDGPPRALAHPLPAGMRDLLPIEAHRRRTLARGLLGHFALHGYELVTPPLFEFADVLERGLGAADAADLLRFVEPESGRVAALRPDMTPQIARMVATRFAGAPSPCRFCYEGTIVRRRQGRARRHRQVPQAGVELYGLTPIDGDVEVVTLAASAMRAAGLGRFVVDLGHAGIARALVEELPAALAPDVTTALANKDAASIGDILRGSGTAESTARAIAALGALHAGAAEFPALFREAHALLDGTVAASALEELDALATTLAGGEVGTLSVDLGELRDLSYYTGSIVHIYAPGPGEAVAAGGRYDDLLARFDAPMPAVGFAVNLDALAHARDLAGTEGESAARVLVANTDDGAGASSGQLATRLRAKGIAAVASSGAANEAYARAWRFTHVLERRGAGWRARTLDEHTVLSASALELLASEEGR